MPYGDRAVLIEVGEREDVLELRSVLSAVGGVVDVVPGARTVLVEFDPAVVSAEQLLRTALSTRSVRTLASEPASVPRVSLEIRYDGPDLGAVADEVGVSRAEIVRRHLDATYRVAFCGFAPGFAYLTGLDPVLRVRRLPEPRTTVPAGSVGLAGEFTAVYPRPSPGGWRLLGSTDAPLWDSARTPPALLAAGTEVRFVHA